MFVPSLSAQLNFPGGERASLGQRSLAYLGRILLESKDNAKTPGAGLRN